MIKRAVAVALTSEYRWKHGAVVAKNNKVLGTAPNKFRNSPVVDGNNVSDHAERAAIRELLKIRSDLRGCTIYVARVSTSGESTISRPCSDCMKAIVESGIDEIVYTNENGGYSVEHIKWTRQPLI